MQVANGLPRRVSDANGAVLFGTARRQDLRAAGVANASLLGRVDVDVPGLVQDHGVFAGRDVAGGGVAVMGREQKQCKERNTPEAGT